MGEQLTIHGQRGRIGRSLVGHDGQVAQDRRQGCACSPAASALLFYLALMLIASRLISVGNGFFKPNISTIVGALYAQGDRRRDAGFTIFYMGINLGSIVGQFFCPLLAERVRLVGRVSGSPRSAC